MVLTEELLHFIWKFRLFNQLSLCTKDGEKLIVEDVGLLNMNAGPDFEFARVLIGDTLWSGHVEIHVNEVDWYNHNHQMDKLYDTTVLHVVWNSSNNTACRTDGTVIPTLEMGKYVDPLLIDGYKELMQNEYWIPCEKQIHTVSDLTKHSWLSRMAVERLEHKCNGLIQLLKETNYNWERVLMINLGRAFGMKVNAFTFQELCIKLDLNLVHKYSDDTLKLESMVFGQAGLLNKGVDAYTSRLKCEYEYLKKIHNLDEVSQESWLFFRMRPFNFPTFRLGQFVALLLHRSYWFEFLLGVETLDLLFDEFEKIVINRYWSDHYRFGIQTGKHGTNWSRAFINHLVINCFVPLLFVYGDFMRESEFKDRAIRWLNELPAETNKITKEYRKCGIYIQNAADSQALLNLKAMYCDKKQCLNCAVGVAILNR